jgi:TonB family protein
MKTVRLALLLFVVSLPAFAGDGNAHRNSRPTGTGPYYAHCPAEAIIRLDEDAFRTLSNAWAPGYLGGSAGNPQPLSTPSELNYPGGVWSAHEPGKVVLAMFIDEKGIPSDVRVVCTSSPKFEKSAVEFGRKMTFVAPLRDGVAIRSTAIQPVEYQP